MRPELLETLHARLRENGLGAHEAELLPHARLAFEMRLDGAGNGAIGSSRWGGAPDVPPGFEWPYSGKSPMAFLAQINLADLESDDENPFPAAGLLQFFADLEGDVAHIGIQSGTELSEAEAPEGADDFMGAIPVHRLKLAARADLPQWASADHHQLTGAWDDDEQDSYNALFNVTESSEDAFAGQLLGHVAGIGYDPRESAFEERDLDGAKFESANPAHQSGIQNWRNLAVFDSVRSIPVYFGDAGYYGFLIPEADLKPLSFARVYPHLQSS